MVAACADSAGKSFQKFKSHGVLAAVSHPAGVTLRLAALSSFMNRSGGPVQAMLAFHKIPPAQLVVVHDDLDLPHGTIRLKFGGGHAGHNGLKDIARALEHSISTGSESALVDPMTPDPWRTTSCSASALTRKHNFPASCAWPVTRWKLW